MVKLGLSLVTFLQLSDSIKLLARNGAWGTHYDSKFLSDGCNELYRGADPTLSSVAHSMNTKIWP